MISVVTPSFRQPDWLRLCVASVADQNGVEIEHILQDGGTEGMALSSLLPAQSAKGYELTLHVEKDNGMYDAINRGLRRATGEICAYLNCDEQYLPGTLATVAAFFAAHPQVDVLFGDVVLVDGDGNPLSYRRSVLPSANHVRLSHLNTASCATFFRRRLLERGLYFDTQWKTIGDSVWVHTLLSQKANLQVLNQPLAIFTFTGQNLGSTTEASGEIRRFQGPGRFTPIRKAAAVLGHRWRKLTAGAYRRRRVDIEIYTLASPHARVRRVTKNAGFSWPR